MRWTVSSGFAIKSVVPGEPCSHWASGSRVTGRLLSWSRPKGFSSAPGDATALSTYVILLLRPSNDPENTWVNCQREGGNPLKSLGSRSGLRTRSDLLWEFRAAYLHGCTHLYVSAEEQETKSFVLLLFVSLARATSSSCEVNSLINSFPLLPLALISVLKSSSIIWFSL